MPFPSLPYSIAGFIKNGLGTAQSGVTVRVKNVTTNEYEDVTTVADGSYLSDLATFPAGFSDGDSVTVQCFSVIKSTSVDETNFPDGREVHLSAWTNFKLNDVTIDNVLSMTVIKSLGERVWSAEVLLENKNGRRTTTYLPYQSIEILINQIQLFKGRISGIDPTRQNQLQIKGENYSAYLLDRIVNETYSGVSIYDIITAAGTGLIPKYLSSLTTNNVAKDVTPWSARYGHTSVVFDSKMWVIGGYDGAYKNDVWYSSDGITWTQATASANWSARSSHKSLVFDNKMWVMGGEDGAYKNDVWYSSDGITWTQATASANWSARSSHKSLVFDNKMWVMGGDPYSNDVWYSSDGITWTQATAAAAWTARYGHESLVFDNKMWVMGGDPYSNDVWYSSDGITWTQATAAAAWTARYGHESLVFDNKMWVMGGEDGAYKNDVWYSSDGITWTQATASADWGGRLVYTSIVFDNKMWVIGGYALPYKNDVWYSTDGVMWLETYNVNMATLITKTFEKQTVMECLNYLSDVVGTSGYDFYVDNDLDLHFKPRKATDSGVTLANTGGSRNVLDWKWKDSEAKDIFNRIVVYYGAGGASSVQRNDLDSQTQYGIREYPSVTDTTITTVAQANALGDRILNRYANPYKEGLITVKTNTNILNLVPGNLITIDISGSGLNPGNVFPMRFPIVFGRKYIIMEVKYSFPQYRAEIKVSEYNKDITSMFTKLLRKNY